MVVPGLSEVNRIATSLALAMSGSHTQSGHAIGPVAARPFGGRLPPEAPRDDAFGQLLSHKDGKSGLLVIVQPMKLHS